VQTWSSVETEVKIEVSDLEPIRERLRALGAIQLGAVDEDNVYLDHEGELAARDQSLRLRHDGQVHLTWKGASDFRDGIVVRPEVEVTVSSFADALEILEKLGFHPSDRLIKRRETWRLRDVEVDLDTLAFGRFVELEGEAPKVGAVAAELGLDPRQGLRSSYRTLQRERRSNRDV
jgi:predicted adenylyl cyclase CyaB